MVRVGPWGSRPTRRLTAPRVPMDTGICDAGPSLFLQLRTQLGVYHVADTQWPSDHDEVF